MQMVSEVFFRFDLLGQICIVVFDDNAGCWTRFWQQLVQIIDGLAGEFGNVLQGHLSLAELMVGDSAKQNPEFRFGQFTLAEFRMVFHHIPL